MLVVEDGVFVFCVVCGVLFVGMGFFFFFGGGGVSQEAEGYTWGPARPTK